ncbi:MAG: hypothetical protein IJJ77_00125 [Paludibacteraceae bacterium]|nr:hypothetical protein [Paludibacteraceae bacterium]
MLGFAAIRPIADYAKMLGFAVIRPIADYAKMLGFATICPYFLKISVFLCKI